MPIVDKYRDMGTMVMGKSESGLVRVRMGKGVDGGRHMHPVAADVGPLPSLVELVLVLLLSIRAVSFADLEQTMLLVLLQQPAHTPPLLPALCVVAHQVGDVLQVMPNKLRVKVEAVYRDEQESRAALSGENLRLRLSGGWWGGPQGGARGAGGRRFAGRKDGRGCGQREGPGK
jgi:hypothetical protein